MKGRRSSGIGYRKRFFYASFGKLVLIFGWGNFGQFKDAFELENVAGTRQRLAAFDEMVAAARQERDIYRDALQRIAADADAEIRSAPVVLSLIAHNALEKGEC